MAKGLWAAVLHRAMVDASYQGDNPENRVARWQADAWIRGNGDDFRRVCDYAGFDPDYVRYVYISGKWRPRTPRERQFRNKGQWNFFDLLDADEYFGDYGGMR